MEFPTLFPKGQENWLHPKMWKVYLHEYATHLLRYNDNSFGMHHRFRYFLLNITVRHHAQDSSIVIAKKYSINTYNDLLVLRTFTNSIGFSNC